MASFRKYLLIFLLGLLFLPLLQNNVRFVDLEKLNGAYTLSRDSAFSVDRWYSGNFQAVREIFLSEEFGLRSLFIRIRNQLDFNLFRKANARNVVIGKNNYLYVDTYITAHYGLDFIGMNSINDEIGRLQFINDTLKKLNKTLILIFAPDKTWFFPEYIPDKYKVPFQNSNYLEYLDLLKKSEINYIDFNNWFVASKNKSKYLLMPKNGTHWSMYGSAVAGDSLIKYIEKVRQIKMRRPVWKSIQVRSDTLFDADVENSMNLLFTLPSPLMAYPTVRFENDSTATRPNVLTEGDSYYWGWQTPYYDIREAFSTSSVFWYYFKKLEHKEVSQQEIRDELAKQDVVIIISTPTNWCSIGSGFIESTYDMFKGIVPPEEKKSEYEKKIDSLKAEIHSDKKWFTIIENEAKDNKISIDSALIINAIWVINHKNK